MNNKVHQVNNLHEEAMNIAEKVYFAQRAKDTASVKKWAKASFNLEKKAAMLLVNDYNLEPTRSLLFKGAACLAINAQLYRDAEQMIGFALSGNPPSEIRTELKELLLEIPVKQQITPLKDELLTNQILQLPKDSRQIAKDFIDFLVQKHSKSA